MKYIIAIIAAALTLGACHTTESCSTGKTCPHGKGDSCCAETPAKKK